MDLSSCYLFEGLSDSHLFRIEAIASKQPVRQGQRLFYKDEPAEFLYILETGAFVLLFEGQGSLKLPVLTVESAGVELLAEVQEPVEFPTSVIRADSGCVGVGALIEPYRYSLSARCARNGSLLVIRRADIQHFIHQHPDMGCCVMTDLARKLLERLNETCREVQIHLMRLVRSATF